VREAATICPRPCKLTFDLLTLKVVSESRVTWATSVPIIVFLRPLCSRLRPDVRDKQTSDVVTSERETSDTHHRLMPPTLEAGIIIADEQKAFRGFLQIGLDLTPFDCLLSILRLLEKINISIYVIYPQKCRCAVESRRIELKLIM